MVDVPSVGIADADQEGPWLMAVRSWVVGGVLGVVTAAVVVAVVSRRWAECDIGVPLLDSQPRARSASPPGVHPHA